MTLVMNARCLQTSVGSEGVVSMAKTKAPPAASQPKRARLSGKQSGASAAASNVDLNHPTRKMMED